MKISKKHVSYRFKKSLRHIAYDHGPLLPSADQLPRKGHPEYIYHLIDSKDRYVWDKPHGRWKLFTGGSVRVRPRLVDIPEGFKPMTDEFADTWMNTLRSLTHLVIH